MPRYLVTQGSLFDPFTYQELAAPIKNMAEIHRQTQDAYDTLSMETEALRNYITDNPEDAKAKEMYDNYINSLNTLQENLWNNGYSAQTRRDLAKARAGYASDITRIQKAIENRQARSNEYWETWHQNPDYVRGADPGLSGLDNYLADDLYGRDYYSYSGNNFMKEIAAEAEARKNELLRDPKILKAGKVPGYITRLIETGYTNEEVNAAYNAIRAAIFSGENGEIGIDSFAPVIEALSKREDNSATLAGVLAAGLESTGALGNIDKYQMQRLLDYGRKGLAAAVGKPEIKDFDDLYFRQNLQLDTYNKQKLIDNLYSGSGDDENPRSGYLMDRTYNRLVSGNAAKMSKFIGKNFTDKYSDGSGNAVTVHLKDAFGRPMLATDAAQMGLQVYNTEGRRDVQAKMPGIDVALPGFDRNQTWDSGQVSDDGRFRTASIKNLLGKGYEEDLQAAKDAGYGRNDVIILEADGKGGWKFHQDASAYYNAAKAHHEDEVAYVRNLNLQDNGLDIYDYAVSPTRMQEIKKEQGLEGIADADVPAALRRMSVDEMAIVPEIVSSGSQDNDKRERFAAHLDNYFGGFSAQGLLGKSSQGAFYKITDGSGYSTAQEGESDKAKVFQLKNGAIDPDCILSIQPMPRDMSGEEGPRIRIRVQNADGTATDWMVDAHALGENIGGVLEAMSDDLALAAHPFRKPKEGFTNSDVESHNWAERVAFSDLFSDDGNLTYFPINPDRTIPSEKDILRDDELFARYQQVLNDRMQQIINDVLDGVTTHTRAIPTNANRPTAAAQTATEPQEPSLPSFLIRK